MLCVSNRGTISPNPVAVSQSAVVTNSGEVREIINGVMKEGREVAIFGQKSEWEEWPSERGGVTGTNESNLRRRRLTSLAAAACIEALKDTHQRTKKASHGT